MTGLLIVAITGCNNEGIYEELQANYPREVEGCICRHLYFESESFSGTDYSQMVTTCNQTVRLGHPSLPKDLESNPELADLRCPEDVDYWLETKREEEAQQAANRRGYAELTTDEPSE